VDTYITAEARQALEALNALSPRKKLFGILIGHKRGHRFIVEKIFPATAGFGLGPSNILRLDELFAGRAVGFYASGDVARLKARLRQPAAAGRLLITGRAGKHAPDLKALAVDFDGRFRFVPLPLIIEETNP
jgi:hypothetical protein